MDKFRSNGSDRKSGLSSLKKSDSNFNSIRPIKDLGSVEVSLPQLHQASMRTLNPSEASKGMMTGGFVSQVKHKRGLKLNDSIDSVDNFALDPAIQKKLFGSISVADMARPEKYSSEFGIKGYDINPKLRFNFANKEHKISPG